MTGDTGADRSPRSATDEERLTARRAVSPRIALIEHLSLLEGGVPGSAAFLAARRLRWSVDHADAMRLWSPSDGVGLPPRKMVDAFLAVHVERTGDDGARRLAEELYAEAEARLSDSGGTPESFPVRTRAEAAAVAERYGYGELVADADLTPVPTGLGMVVTCTAVPALFGIFLLLQPGGEVLALVSGLVLLALAAVILVVGVLARRRPRPVVPRQMFFFTGGVVLGVDGVLDAYAWPDVEVVEREIVSNVGSDDHEVRSVVPMIGPREGTTLLAVPSMHRDQVFELAAEGGAAFR